MGSLIIMYSTIISFIRKNSYDFKRFFKPPSFFLTSLLLGKVRRRTMGRRDGLLENTCGNHKNKIHLRYHNFKYFIFDKTNDISENNKCRKSKNER
jgi:hypothetical protein